MSKSLESLIIEPPKTATASMIWLHGLGADGHDFANIVPQFNTAGNSHWRFILPHAPLRPITLNNGVEMRAWYDIRSLENLREEDEAGIVDSQRLINQLIDAECAKGIDSQHIVLVGFSQGGAMALFSGLRYRKRLGGVIALSAYLPFAQQIPVTHHTPIFMGHGKLDTIVPLRLGKYSAEQLQQHQLPITWREYPIGHHLCPEELADIQQWLTTKEQGNQLS